MTQRTVREVAGGFSYLEGPRWHDGRLWVSDFYTHQVCAVSLDGHVEPILEVPNQPSGLGWLPDGRLLAVSMRDHTILRREKSGEIVVHADVSSVATGLLNDMVVDADGRCYVGNFGFDLMGGAAVQATPIALVQPDGSVSVASEPLFFPNGSIITPDGHTLIVGETLGNRISAFDIGPNGALGPRRDWAVFGQQAPVGVPLGDAVGLAKAAPDGACLDAEGAVWFADAVFRRVVRVAAGGTILEEIPVEGGVYACMLGGDDGRTLFACVAPNFNEHERATTLLARLVAVDVDVPHAGLP